jgi:hypothetical protein
MNRIELRTAICTVGTTDSEPTNVKHEHIIVAAPTLTLGELLDATMGNQARGGVRFLLLALRLNGLIGLHDFLLMSGYM